MLDDLPDTISGRLWRPVIAAELADDAEQWQLAIDHLCGGSGPVHLIPHAQWRLAQHLAADRDRSAAREVIADGLARSDRLGAEALTSRLTVLARQVGLSASTATGAGGSPA